MSLRIGKPLFMFNSLTAGGRLLQQSISSSNSLSAVHHGLSACHGRCRLYVVSSSVCRPFVQSELAECSRNALTVRRLHSLPCSLWCTAKDPCVNVQQSGEKTFLERLQAVQQFLTLQIPEIMSSSHEYRMYAKDLIFENNWDVGKPVRSVGIGAYVKSVVKARYYVHGHYAKVKVTILNSSIDEAAGAVQVHWRLTGLPQMKVFFMFWKFAPFRFKETAEKQSDYLEGISTFFVDQKGFICKHILNRVNNENEGKHQEVVAR